MREERWLTFEPWPGLINNGRMCVQTMLVLARLTGRTLVWPERYRPLGEPGDAGPWRPPDPSDVLDLGRLRALAPIAPPGLRPPGPRAILAAAPGSSVFCFPRIPAPGTRARARLLEFAAGRRRFLALTPEMKRCRTLHVKNPLLEHFYAFYFFLDENRSLEERRLIARNVVYRREILEAARRALRSLGRFCAVHVRRGDFLRNYPRQRIPPARLERTLRRFIPRGSKLYVATDERSRPYFSPLERTYDAVFLKDVRGALPPDVPEAWLGGVEQLICAEAEVFVGTRLSTFSSYITRLRGLRGARDQEVYFTDGYPGSALDGFGDPAYSWVNWVQTGSPLWGREFKEGWTVSR